MFQEANTISQTLADIFEQEGTPQIVSGNTPFLLDGNENVWLVRSGAVEIFSVRVEEGQPVGRRYHYFSAHPGHGMFGMDLNRYGNGLGFLAVGSVGTRLLKLNLSRLRELANAPDYNTAITTLIEHWVGGLSYGLSKSIIPQPRFDIILEPEKTNLLNDGKKAGSKNGILWVKYLEGNTLFIGMEELSLVDQEALFPVSPDTWLQALEKTSLLPIDTKTAVTQASSWQGLEFLYEAIFKCEVFNTSLAAADELNRLRKKAANEELSKGNALADLAAVIEKKAPEPFRGDLENPLFAACWEVGKAMGITLQMPPRSKDQQPQKDELGDIARASRFRIRRVRLKDQWWQKDGGPFLAFLAENKRPIALLPTSVRSYELRDPVGQTSTLATAEIAATIEPFGFAFYRPFAEQAITVSQLLKFGFQGCKSDLRMIFLMGLIAGLLQLIVPLATGAIFSTVIPEAERGQLLQLTLALFVGALATAAFRITRSMAVLRIESRIDRSLQAAIWDRLLSLPAPFFRNYVVGDLAVRAMGIGEIRRLLSDIVITALITSIFSSFNFLLLFYYDWRLAFVAGGLTIVTLVVTSLAGYLQVRHQRELKKLEGKISGIVLQFISGISKLRVAGAEAHAFAYWAKEFSAQKKLAFSARTIENYLVIFNAGFPIISSMALFGWIAFYSPQVLSTGSFLAFFAAFSQFQAASLYISTIIISILGIVPIYERVKPILTTLPEAQAAKANPGELSGAIELNHVAFRYSPNGPLILKDVSLQIEPGEFVAFVGPSGSGKSTLFRLLLGFEKPESGSIYFDGQDLAMLDVQAVRRQIGVVLQNSQLMTGDIFTNIVGSAPLTIDDAWEAARMAGLEEDIKQMPMGMQTVISEGGSTFSGGQRQRLAIARAIVKRPRMMLFDEATSALDNRTQAQVSKSLESMQATRIVIAHRLSTIINADRIFVIKDGIVVQSGSYQELMDQEGPFAELAKRQIA